jgi:SynChlorMet cassette radical SAM/SPASM protein ScmF
VAVKGKSEAVPPLAQIYFYLTEGSNLACRHCWIAPKFDQGGGLPALPVELFVQAIMEAKPLGLKGVKLTGGEPLMHPQFSRLIEIVKREDLCLTVETNGILCTPHAAAEMASVSHKFVAVSIDGADQETHEWLRGVPGCFKQAQEAVRNLVEAGINPQIVVTINRRNALQLKELVRQAQELGASSVKFNLLQPTARGKALEMSGEALTVEEAIKLGRYVESELAPQTKIALMFDYPYAFRSLRRIARGEGCGRCAIQSIIGVIASGNYALCGIGYHLPELVFGRVGRDSLERIWTENQVLSSLRAGLPQKLEGICSRCVMNKACLGSCLAQNYYNNRNLWAPFWFCHKAEKENLFPSSRLNE